MFCIKEWSIKIGTNSENVFKNITVTVYGELWNE
jgi:hypothetical protein